MDLKQQARITVPAAGLALCLTHTASAAPIGDYQFNAADTEGWTAAGTTGLTTDGDSLNGTASSNDPQLLLTSAGLATMGTWDTAVFRVRERGELVSVPGTTVLDPGPTDVPFSSVGLILILNATNVTSNGFTAVDSGEGFFTLTIDISTLGSATINNIRFDPIGGAASNSNSETNGNTYEVDFIQINDDTPIPEPSSLALLGLGGMAMMRRRR